MALKNCRLPRLFAILSQKPQLTTGKNVFYVNNLNLKQVFTAGNLKRGTTHLEKWFWGYETQLQKVLDEEQKNVNNPPSLFYKNVYSQNGFRVSEQKHILLNLQDNHPP